MAKSVQEKEQVLLEKIQKARQDLNRLKDKRRREIGQLAMKAGLADMDNEELKIAFERIAEELTI